ncbi:uncharacterized protein AMSG_00697 [Thecamonas trahens ATCC 50062]|uniref:Uncharacterized protein n=1 Tax=Thecamonas trahens ATCC 50062 TaxID=461836 RepID=A0A0L0DE83_THETB|nr:hypothetical protein AMSG_00697 [Thecamonas trahens ATCC 50062]KNC50535.1 hypothetical protein AMSG_00697 [Thecamonas trahens ATCC 50062]|eukprot:XP_013762427.1 hypothetical protein AMSG_00697 [Thecamonas trahens ATCC 50062]
MTPTNPKQKPVPAPVADAGGMLAASLRMLISLVFNAQLLPLLAFLTTGALSLLLHLFFAHVVPAVAGASLAALVAALVLLASAVVLAALVLRSFAYLATDPFSSREHEIVLRKVLRLGVGNVTTLAVAMLAISAGICLHIAPDAGAPAASHGPLDLLLVLAGPVVVCACVQVVAAVVGALWVDLWAMLSVHRKTASPALADAWTRLLLAAKVAGLAAAAALSLRGIPGIPPHTSPGEIAIVLIFGQVLCFAGLWVALELASLVRLVWRLAGSASFWVGAASVMGGALAAGHVLGGAYAACLTIIPTAALLEFVYLRRVVGRTQVRPSSAVRTVTMLIRSVVGTVLVIALSLLVYTAYQGWTSPVIDDVFTVDNTVAGVRLTHEGYGHPQSVTTLGWSESTPAWRRSADSHSICSLAWRGLNLFDIGFLAQLAYVNGGTPYWEAMTAAFFDGTKGNGGDNDWIVTPPVTATGAAGVALFAEFYSPTRNISVVAIRGTNPSNLWDVVQDLAIWYPAALLQTAVALPTTLSLWPTDVLASVVGVLGSLESWLDPERDARFYHAPILAHLHARAAELPPSTTFVVTGHSLGGGLAKIVGALGNVTAVALSGPGLSLTRHRFGLSLDALQDTSITVMPTGDLVPRFDIQAGLIYQLTCPHTSPLLCHDPMVSMCHIFARCGSSAWPALASCNFAPWTVE